MKKINIYYVFDALLAIAIVLFFLSRNDIALYGFLASVLIANILVLLEAGKKTQLTPAIVINNSDMPVIFKPKNESNLKEMAPHTSAEGVEGIKVAGKVFKACSGTHVVIGKTGRITTKALSGKVANIIRGGFFSSAPDESWNLLFNA